MAVSTFTALAARGAVIAVLVSSCASGLDESAPAGRNDTTVAAATVDTTTVDVTEGEPTHAEVDDLPLAESELTPGVPMRLSLGTHCGVRILSRTINGFVWRTTAGVGTVDWVPAEWNPGENYPDGPIAVRVELSADGLTITASLNGRSVVYDRGGSDFEPEDLCE